MEVTATNGVKVYNISAGKATPLWLQDKKKKDKAYLKRLGTFTPFSQRTFRILPCLAPFLSV